MLKRKHRIETIDEQKENLTGAGNYNQTNEDFMTVIRYKLFITVKRAIRNRYAARF